MATPTKWGNEFLVTAINAGDKVTPSVTALSNGQFVVVWQEETSNLGDASGTAIHAQLFNADGTKDGAAFRVNSVTFMDQLDPKVTALDNGGFVVTWQSLRTPGLNNDADVHARIFDANGNAPNPDFVVNASAADTQGRPAITTLSDGRFVIAWTDHTGGDNNVRFQMFNANGSKVGGVLDAEAVTVGDQGYASIAPLSNGRFIITWENDTTNVLTGRVFNSDGTPQAAEFKIGPTGLKFDSTITELSDGRLVAAWTEGSDGFNIHAQIYDANGVKVGNEIVVTTGQGAYGASVSAAPDGDFVITWRQSPPGIGSFEVYAQKFHGADGSADGARFQANTIMSGHQGGLGDASTTLADGRIVIAYTDDSNSLDSPTGTVVRGQIIDPRDHGMDIAGRGDMDDQLFGTRFNDNMKGGGGADLLNGGDGIDTVTYASSLSYVIVNLETNANLVGDAQGDKLSAIENLVGSDHDDGLTGDGGTNVIEGGAGDDGIDGRGGDDTAVFSHDFNDYTVMERGSHILVAGPDGLDFLTSIEHLQFANVTITPADIANDGNPLFDTLFYLSRNADVFQAGVNALSHFNMHGWHEGRDPNTLFDTTDYLAVNKDVAASGMNPLDHYHQIGWQQGRDPGMWFDTTLYLIHNPDVAAAGIDPLLHYLQSGLDEGREKYEAIGQNIAGGFDAQYYLFHNPDVAAAGIDPLLHFNAVGWQEGRDPNAWFDTSGYLAFNTDVAAAGINPLQHYEAVGWTEGRDASAHFDTLKYLAANPDVAAAHINPLDHFLQNGIYEGRQAVNDGMWN
jgi:Ca2+-binding RTX toxin-like protein